jgi:hypothetical protein
VKMVAGIAFVAHWDCRAHQDTVIEGRLPASGPPPTWLHRFGALLNEHSVGVTVGGGLVLGLVAGLVFWYRDSTQGTGGTGQFIFDVFFIGLIACSLLGMFAIAMAYLAVELLRGSFLILLGDLFHWVSKKRNGEAAKAGDTAAQEKIDRWKRWQREVTR